MRGSKLNKLLDQIVGTPLILALALFARLRPARRQPDSPKNILVVKLAAVGDTLLLIPSVRSLKRQFPDAAIVLLATSVNADLAELFPQYFSEILILDVRAVVRNPILFIRFLRRLRKGRFEMALDFEQWALVTPIVLELARIPWTLGFKSKSGFRHLLYNTSVLRQSEQHEAKNFLNLAQATGAKNGKPELELPVRIDLAQETEKYLRGRGWRGGQPLVLIHPGCGSHGFPRQWPISSYNELCLKLITSHNPFFVFTGLGREKELADELAQHFVSSSTAWDKPGLQELIALLSLADLVVTGNNGVMHLAAALKRPQLALHGPTNAKKWGPLNERAVIIESSCPGCPCLDLGFEYHRTDGFCMTQIAVDEVYSAAHKVLSTLT